MITKQQLTKQLNNLSNSNSNKKRKWYQWSGGITAAQEKRNQEEFNEEIIQYLNDLTEYIFQKK